MKPKKFTKDQGIDNEMQTHNDTCDEWNQWIDECPIEETIYKDQFGLDFDDKAMTIEVAMCKQTANAIRALLKGEE